MKKILVSILAVLMLVFCLTACGEESTSETSEGKESETSATSESEAKESETTTSKEKESEAENSESASPSASETKASGVPTNRAEAVGIYTFATTNSFGTGVQYALWLNGDGTANVFYNSSFSGLNKYTADEWIFNDDGTVFVGICVAEDGEPEGDVYNEDFSSDWVLNDDGTCVPVGWTGVVKAVGEGSDVGDGDLPEEAYPPYAEDVGIYTFGTTNSFGTGVQYALWLNGDGTAYVFYNSSFAGLCKYTADKWSVEDDGSVHVDAVKSEDGEEPEGDVFNDDFSSDWDLNLEDGTCVPVGWTGVVKAVGEGDDVGDGDLPEEAYPVNNP